MSADDFDIDALIFGTKRCTVCGDEKPRNSEHFTRDRHETDGLTHECRACHNAACADSYRRHPRRRAEARA